MSDMTDAEFLRECACDEDEEFPCGVSACRRFREIADRLDAMGWRDKPPDTVGDWAVLRMDARSVGHVTTVIVQHDGALIAPTGFSWQAGDRVFKLPEVTR